MTKSEKEEVDEFYRPFFYIRYSAHEFYKSALGYFDKTFIPNGIHSAIIDRFYNDWGMASVLDNKCYYPYMFENVSMPKMIAYRLAGYWYDGDNRVVDYGTVKSILMQYDELFVKKATDSWGGLGVHYYNKRNETIEELQQNLQKIWGDLVIQECIRQSEEISRLNPSSVNTVRIMTHLMDDGTVKIRSSILRMGAGGSKVDNASSGGISTGIEDDGRLKAVAYSNTGVKYEEHPTTKIKFSDVVVPNFDKMRQMVKTLQVKFPHFRLISWDLAVNFDNEPMLIEANLCDGELDFHQLNNGSIFGDDTEAILHEVFSNKRTYCGNNGFVRLIDNIIGVILHEKRPIECFKYHNADNQNS